MFCKSETSLEVLLKTISNSYRSVVMIERFLFSRVRSTLVNSP